MTLEIPDDLAEAVQEASRNFGVPVQDLVVNALRAHFPIVEPELQAEFDAWEAASNASMLKVDRLLGEDS